MKLMKELLVKLKISKKKKNDVVPEINSELLSLIDVPNLTLVYLTGNLKMSATAAGIISTSIVVNRILEDYGVTELVHLPDEPRHRVAKALSELCIERHRRIGDSLKGFTISKPGRSGRNKSRNIVYTSGGSGTLSHKHNPVNENLVSDALFDYMTKSKGEPSVLFSCFSEDYKLMVMSLDG